MYKRRWAHARWCNRRPRPFPLLLLFGGLQLLEGGIHLLDRVLRRGVLAYLQVDLLAEDRDRAGRLDAYSHLLAHDREDRNLDLVADHDALVGLPCQNQHLRLRAIASVKVPPATCPAPLR